MATRRRRTNTPKPDAPVETTHEEMLEVAAEREEAAAEVLESEEIAQFLDVMAEEVFSNLGEQDFFDPTPAIPPAPKQPDVILPKPPLLSAKQPRYLLRRNRNSDYTRG